MSGFADWGFSQAGKSEVRDGDSWTHGMEGGRSWARKLYIVCVLSSDLALHPFFFSWEFTVIFWTWTDCQRGGGPVISDSEQFHLDESILNLFRLCFIPHISVLL